MSYRLIPHHIYYFSDIEICIVWRKIGVWRGSYTSRSLYLSHFIYPSSSSLGVPFRINPLNLAKHCGNIPKTTNKYLTNPPNFIETYKSVVIHMSHYKTDKSLWCVIQISPNVPIRIHMIHQTHRTLKIHLIYLYYLIIIHPSKSVITCFFFSLVHSA